MRIFKVVTKRSMRGFVGVISMAFLLLVGFSTCTRDRQQPGYSYFPDMERSQAFESYSSNPFFRNGMTNRLPREGTVSVDLIPYSFVKDEADAKQAGMSMENPFPKKDGKVFNQGKNVFNQICANCHGDVGDGKGFLFSSGRYPYPPADLKGERATRKPEGELFHNVSIGYGVMGPHQNIISRKDRWMVVRYIKEGIQK